MGKILVTDSLFIHDKHIDQLKQHGHKTIRLDKVKATEKELINAISDVDGYILGGIEEVSENVIGAAKKLKAIVFTGSGYKEFIPGHKLAAEKGIAIANAPGGNASSVAEYTICMMMAMARKIFSLGRAGEDSFQTTSTFSGKSIGIVGLGNIGILVAKQLKELGVKEVLYYSPRRKYHYESGFGIKYASLEEVFRTSDIVSLHASKDAGAGYVNNDLLSLMKKGAILVNASYPDAVDEDALISKLKEEKISAIYDAPPKSEDFSSIPTSHWYCSNAQTAFNTFEALDTVSSMSVRSIINLLDSGNDLFKVN